METDEERTARLEKTVTTTQLRLALETEEERRAKKGMDLIWIGFGFNLENFQNQKNSRNELARPVIGTIILVVFLFFL